MKGIKKQHHSAMLPQINSEGSLSDLPCFIIHVGDESKMAVEMATLLVVM